MKSTFKDVEIEENLHEEKSEAEFASLIS